VAIANGGAPADLPTLADGLAVTRIVDAAKMASRQHRRIKLGEVK
jgi:predicted dehydrogenase